MPSLYAERFHDPAHAAAYRDKFRASWTRRLSQRAERRALEAALEAAGPAASGFVLDVPCGAGRMAPNLARRASRFLGLDLSLAMVHLCRLEAGPVAQASAWALPLGERAVDLAACLRLTHHVALEADRLALLAELCRVSRRALIISFLDRAAPKQRLHRLRCRLGGRSAMRPTWCAGALEEAAVGFRLAGLFPISPWFSGQTLALLLREDA